MSDVTDDTVLAKGWETYAGKLYSLALACKRVVNHPLSIAEYRLKLTDKDLDYKHHILCRQLKKREDDLWISTFYALKEAYDVITDKNSSKAIRALAQDFPGVDTDLLLDHILYLEFCILSNKSILHAITAFTEGTYASSRMPKDQAARRKLIDEVSSLLVPYLETNNTLAHLLEGCGDAPFCVINYTLDVKPAGRYL